MALKSSLFSRQTGTGRRPSRLDFDSSPQASNTFDFSVILRQDHSTSNGIGKEKHYCRCIFVVINTLQLLMPNRCSALTPLNRYNMFELLKCDRSLQ
ncbi:hypothetical protein ACFX14_003328 [Malus domestica]|uniref:Uncharacterized protein n=1 Tax=Malus domestica TaxID=3750 RepID=A0A498IYI5_MALDO|nr:hypothetical protein DVH24_034265 [Malus domestica]